MNPFLALAAIGGTTVSAELADSQDQIDQALGATAGFGTDTVAQYAAAYRGSQGGPILTLLGFNPFQLVATGGFHLLYWGIVVIFLGIMAVISVQHVLNGRYSVRGRHPLNALISIYLRLIFGVLMIAELPLLYGTLMTINRTLTDGIRSIGQQSMSALLQGGGIGPLALAEARADAIRQAAARRALALYSAGASRAEMVQIGMWYNAMAAVINPRLTAAQRPGVLPILDTSGWADAAVPDDQVSAAIGRTVVRNFGSLVAALAALPAEGGPLQVDFPSGSGSNLGLLSSALAADDAAAAQALTLPAVPASSAAFESARGAYGQAVLGDTLNYLDRQLQPVLGAAPSLAASVKGWFAESVEHAAAASVGTLVGGLRAVIDWIGRSIGVMLTRIVAFVFTTGSAALLEIELFVLVLAMPFWLLPATEDAFHGVLRSLGALTLAAPAYQFLMLFVDALMGLVLKYLCLGPLASDAGAGAAIGGAAYSAVTAIAAASIGPEILILAMSCYLCAYLFLAIYMALKTPRIVTAFLKGAGAAGAFLSTFATGLVAGAATAAATASVAAGAGGVAGRWLGGGAARAAGSSARPASAPIGPFVANRFSSGGGASLGARLASARWWEASRFGARTFVECLDAKSPGDALGTALKALGDQRKQEGKAEASQAKAEQSSARAAAKAAAPAKAKRARK